MKSMSMLSRLAGIAVVVVLSLHGCGKAGRQEHEAGAYLAAALKSYACQTEVKDFTSPCGAIDVRYEVSPDALFVNVYGIHAPEQISELVARVRQSKEAKAIRFKVTVTFYKNIGSHSVVRSETIGG
jgi:hypothetical protein